MQIAGVLRRLRRLTFFITAAVVLGFAPGAWAHAVLVKSTPAHGTVLPGAPATLVLTFNEPIDPRISTVVVIANGTRTTLEPQGGEDATVTYKAPDLRQGLYVVDWRVISTVDGHLTRGSFAFGVGAITASIGAATDAAAPTWSEVVARWMGLVGVLLLTGGVVMFLLLPTPEAMRETLRARLYQMAIVSTALMVVAGTFRLLSDAAAIAGSATLLGATAAEIVRVLTVSHTGHDLIFRWVGAFFLLSQLKPARSFEREGLLAMLGVMLLGPILTTHGLTAGVLGSVISLVHIIAASVWVGGLAFFGGVYLPLVCRSRPEAARPAAARFSRAALVAVIVLVATGVVQTYLYLGSPSALLGPAYGRTLLVKLIILAPLLVTAAVNRWRVLPALARMTRMWRPLMLLVRLETALALSVALFAAAVAISQPAKGADYTQGQVPAQIPQQPQESKLTMGGTLGDLNVAITLAPARQGANTMELEATTGLEKKPLSGDVRFIVRLASIENDVPGNALRVDGKDGKAAGEGPFIGAPGWWALDVTVRRRGVEDVTLSLPLLIGTPGLGPNDPQAMALLKKAEEVARRANTWREVEHYSSGDGYYVTRQYWFAKPDRLRYVGSTGVEGRVLGVKSYYRERDGKWNLTEKPEPVQVQFRFPLATDVIGARLGVRVDEDGRPLRVATFSDPGGQLHFAVYIDPATGHVHRLFMWGEAHHMVTNMFGYDEKMGITPP